MYNTGSTSKIRNSTYFLNTFWSSYISYLSDARLHHLISKVIRRYQKPRYLSSCTSNRILRYAIKAIISEPAPWATLCTSNLNEVISRYGKYRKPDTVFWDIRNTASSTYPLQRVFWYMMLKVNKVRISYLVYKVNRNYIRKHNRIPCFSIIYFKT